METQTRLSRHNKFRRRTLLVYSPSHRMTLLYALYCPRDVMLMRSYSSYSEDK